MMNTKRTMTNTTLAQPMRTPPSRQSTGGIIWGALEDLRAQGQIATRQVVAEATGLKLVIVDDHFKRMVEDGLLRRPVNGVVEIVDMHPEPRPVSLTVLPGGMAKIEIGDICLEIWPQERRALAGLLQGDACQLSNILTGQQVNTLVDQVWNELKALKRELGG